MLVLLGILMIAIFTWQVYNMIHYKGVIEEFKEKIEKLQSVVNKQQNETRALLTAYMTESRVISFYNDISPLIQDDEVLQLFNELAKDEEKHIALLENCMAKKSLN